MTMRLTDTQKQAIIETFQTHFRVEDELWLFGSRVDDQKRGGDIDLYVKTVETDAESIFTKKIAFLVDLKRRIGDQKIDLVIEFGDFKLPIYDHARETGIRLV